MDELGYFPVPYPDECYYSILCRYKVHTGIPTGMRTIERLFGKDVTADSLLMMPYMSCKVPEWVSEETGITEEGIIRNHTAFHYFKIIYARTAGEKWLENMRTGRKNGSRFQYRKSMASGRLRYCPLCAYEEKIKYGEMYWHRMQQLEGVDYCYRHGSMIIESSVSRDDRKKSFVPASYALRDIYGMTLDECRRLCTFISGSERARHGSVYADIKWLLENGSLTGGLEEIRKKYAKFLIERGWLKTAWDNIEKAGRLRESIRDYFGADFIKSLHMEIHEYLTWDSIPMVAIKFMTPLQHVLMMEYLCGSVEAFYNVPV